MGKRSIAFLSIIMLIALFTTINLNVYSDNGQPVILPGEPQGDTGAADTQDTTGTSGNTGTSQTAVENQQLSIVTTSLTDGVKMQKYSMTLNAQGGAPPYAWFVEGLPGGLYIENYTGIIKGSPVKAGEYNLQVTVFDTTHKSVSGKLKLTVKESGAAKTQQTSNGTKIKIGDYIQFGRYLGKPILWRVINIDEAGNSMLFSESIISFKPYDSAEKGNTEYDEDSTFAEDCGSSRWTNSNLREWLNSSEKKVKYTTQPPTQRAVYKGYNDYSEEAGFLYNFTANEQGAIEPVIHSSILTSFDKDFIQGGEEPLITHYETYIPSKAIENEDTAYFEMTTDKVFLLSISEVAGYIEARGWDWKRGATVEARKQAKAMDYYENHGTYWLRTSQNSQLRGGIVCMIDTLGETNRISPYMGDNGVCPALYINMGKVKFESGAGTKAKPYVVKK